MARSKVEAAVSAAVGATPEITYAEYQEFFEQIKSDHREFLLCELCSSDYDDGCELSNRVLDLDRAIQFCQGKGGPIELVFSMLVGEYICSKKFTIVRIK